jgi:glutamate dehydrogenase (NAD(P)+)
MHSEDVFRFADEFGPAKIVHIHNAQTGLRAVVVIDNTACGPAIGGVRMAPDVSTEEAFRLARAMTFKNAAAGLAHGGGKAVIFGDPQTMTTGRKSDLVRSFACAIADLVDYIPGPDMGTDETCMAWVHEEIGRAVGLPAEIGGIPLDAIGATAYGLAAAAEVAQEFCDVELSGARVAIQGYGAVGRHAAQFLAAKGTRLVAAADSGGTIIHSAGLDLDELAALKAAGRSVTEARRGERADVEAVISIGCDILIPAARPDVVHADNVETLDTRLVLQGANIPFTREAEVRLHELGVLVVPDFIANAGGVICAAVEYDGGTEASALATIDEKLRANTRAVLQAAASAGEMPRAAAERVAQQHVRAAMALDRWAPKNRDPVRDPGRQRS